MRIDSDVRANLLELIQVEAQAKEALTEAIAEVADRFELDKAVLKKVITAEFKDQVWKLKANAQMTLDLLESRDEAVNYAKRLLADLPANQEPLQ